MTVDETKTIVEIDGKPMMRRKDAAEYIKRSPNTVRRLFNDGVLEGRREGGVLWLTVASLDQFNENPIPLGRPEGTIAKPPRSKAAQQLREYNREKQRERRAKLKGGGKKTRQAGVQ